MVGYRVVPKDRTQRMSSPSRRRNLDKKDIVEFEDDDFIEVGEDD